MQLETNQQTVVTAVSPEQRLSWFDQHAPGLVTFVEQTRLGCVDARATVAFVRGSLDSSADNLEDFLQDVKAALVKQIEANRWFVKIYLDKQKFVHSVVRRLVGRQDYSVDTEAMTADVFVAVLRKLTNGSFTYTGGPQLNSWLKQTARGVVSDFRAKHARRLKRVQEGLPEMINELPNGYAVHREDKIEIGEEVKNERGGDEVE